MIVVRAGVKVHLALGHTDMRKGLDGLAILIQEQPKTDPFWVSERMDPDQFELALEDIESDIERVRERHSAPVANPEKRNQSASRCPIIRRALNGSSTSTAPSATIAVGPCTASAIASARCSTMFRPALGAAPRNKPAGPVDRRGTA
ncbi:IS66 family insertion sequence element accessory protein TnpB [Mesorhizobium sp. M0482]|uniref:IS66 family insertion sequence element accessory protein TnpB n=1 Tax=Mesorhizobium sp. M0664 TaxID=2956982 RepID=UPI003336AEC3